MMITIPTSTDPIQIRPSARSGYLNVWLVAFHIVSAFLFSTSGIRAQDLPVEKVIGWDFQRADDRNLDRQPDGWRRRRDRLHPFYITSQIVSRDIEKARRASQEQMFIAKLMHAVEVGKWDDGYVPEAIPPGLEKVMDRFVFENCLEIRMDGGSAEWVSPSFPIDPRFSYTLQAEVQTVKLDGHQAWLELQLLDSQEQASEVLSTEKISNTIDWQTVVTSIGMSTDDQVRWGRVHIKVEPHGELLINGLARFDKIEVYRLPRLTLSTDLAHHLVQPGTPFSVKCLAMGIPKQSTSVRFELRNHLLELLASDSIPLESIQAVEPQPEPSPAPGMITGREERLINTTISGLESERTNEDGLTTDTTGQLLKEKSYDGLAEWNLHLDSPGLYYASAVLGTGNTAQRRELKIGVMPHREKIVAGPFGWSITEFDHQVTPERLPGLVAKFGAGWLKYPVWFDQLDIQYADQIVDMTERLQLLGVRCVGKIAQPPASQMSIFGEGTNKLPAISVFRDHRAWEPVLDPVLTRMGLKLDWFQLGEDNDHSFQSQANVVELLTEVRARMQTYSQELRLALNWPWDVPQSDDGPAKPWNAVQLTANPQLTSAELLEYTENLGSGKRTAWVQLNPLPADRYSLLDRVRDLTERMIVVKQTGLPAAFLVDPFDPQQGLLANDLTVGEMLLPWANLVNAIGDKDYIGSFTMPGGSTNHCFQSDHDSVIIVWNDVPTDEQLFVGAAVDAIDVWGETLEVEEVTAANGFREQRFSVGRWPVIVRGIDAGVVRCRQQFRVELSNLSSMIGGARVLPLELTNSLAQSATGTLSLSSDSLLGKTQPTIPLQVATAGRTSLNLPIQVRPDASAGKHPLRFDVAVNVGEPYQFSIYRSINLGSGEVEFNWELSQKSNTEVELRIELINRTTEEISFDCRYFPVGQPYQRFQITRAHPGTSLHEVTIRVAEQDIASGAWIRCEQIGADRVLNYRLEF